MAEPSAAEKVLAALVALKDGPRDERYQTLKPIVWAQARAIVDTIDLPTEPVPEPPPIEPTGEPVVWAPSHATWCDPATAIPHDAPYCPPPFEIAGDH